MKRKCWIIVLLIVGLICAPVSVFATGENDAGRDSENEALMAGLWETDISAIKAAYEAKLITCTQLTQYYLERIGVYNDTYNCFITLCDDALVQAALRDEQMQAGETGMLMGIPVVIKDNMDYAGYRTTNGFSKNSGSVRENNAQVVQYLLDQGAVIIGKTNMSTQAQDARASRSIAVGETKNAYNDLMAAGGSSGGSAAATSLNFAVAGLGTDTNSSLRLPAALNGCISLRSTWGTLSTDGIRKLNGSRDVPGAITRTVMDQAIMLDVISGGETTYVENLNSEILSGLRIGVLKELTERDQNHADEEVVAAFANAVEELKECGAEVVEVSIPNVIGMATATLGGGTASKERMYKKIQETMEENGVSALIFPTYLNTPLRSGRDGNGRHWYPSTQRFINNTSQFSSCASLPEIAMPIGYHSLGAGIGMEIAALRNQEQLLLDIAYSYFLRYDHRKPPENAGDLYASSNYGGLIDIVNSYKAEQEEAELISNEAFNEPIIPEETAEIPDNEETTETDKNIVLNQGRAGLIIAILYGLLLIFGETIISEIREKKMP